MCKHCNEWCSQNWKEMKLRDDITEVERALWRKHKRNNTVPPVPKFHLKHMAATEWPKKSLEFEPNLSPVFPRWTYSKGNLSW